MLATKGFRPDPDCDSVCEWRTVSRQIKSLAVADTATLLVNVLRWAAGTKAPSTTVRVGVWKKAELAAFLRSRGWQAEVVDGSTDTARLAACRVVCLDVHDLTDDRWLTALAQYTRQGGGLVAGGLGWGGGALAVVGTA